MLVEDDEPEVCDAVSLEPVALAESSVFVAEAPVAAAVAPAVMVTRSELIRSLPRVVV